MVRPHLELGKTSRFVRRQVPGDSFLMQSENKLKLALQLKLALAFALQHAEVLRISASNDLRLW